MTNIPLLMLKKEKNIKNAKPGPGYIFKIKPGTRAGLGKPGRPGGTGTGPGRPVNH